MAAYVTASEPMVVTSGTANASGSSGVSWGAILVGASAAAALSLVLVILGFGLGLSSVSPWSHSGASAQTLGVSTIAWIAFTQLAASALGGYLAGRLRVKWVDLHTDEVYFRDTAHGFMAWAVASLATAALLGSALGGILGTGVRASAAVASAAAGTATVAATQVGAAAHPGSDNVGYFVDSMFRKDATHLGTPTNPETRAEALKIFATDLRTGKLTDEDRQYLGTVVAQETGMAPADAEKRVADKFNQTKAAADEAENNAKQAADAARKVAAHSSLWMFIALMLGAFFASLAATAGGRRRDLMA